MVSNYSKVLRSDESIKIRSTYGEVFGTILGNLDRNTLGLMLG